MDPAEYLRALRRRWTVIVAAVAVAVTVAWVTSTVVPVAVPTVSYRAEVWVLDTGATTIAPGEISSLSTMASLVTIRPVAERVAGRVGFEGDPMSLAATVDASTGSESGILVIAATDDDPKEAEKIAEAFTLELLGFLSDRKNQSIAREQEFLSKQLSEVSKDIDSLESQIGSASGSEADRLEAERNGKLFLYGSLQQQFQQLGAAAAERGRLQIIQEATAQAVTTEGFQPPSSTTSRLIMAGILGLLAGVGLALLLERLDTRIKTKHAAEKHFGLPVLSEIPPMEGNGASGIMTSSQPTSPAADAFRLLAASLADSEASHPADAASGGALEPRDVKVILVASAASQDGRSSVVANLAAAFAQVGKRALILSCDFRHPTLHHMFGLQNGTGLSDVLRKHWNGGAILDAHVRKTQLPGVALVPSGSLPPRPSTLLTTPSMVEVLREARRLADVVLLDTPPILLASDAAHLIGLVDLVLVVARAGKTTAEQAERTRDLLKQLDAPIAGLALNEAREFPHPSRRGWRTVASGMFHKA